MADEFQPQLRLHPMSWLFGVVTFIRQFLLPLLAAALFGSKDGMPSWLGFMIVPMIGAALWKQYFYRYGFGPGGLVIREGVLFKNIRQIDYSRIENIDTQRNVLHRLLGVAEVRVETSTGGKPEALIQVLSMESAAALRQTVFAAREERSDRAIEEATEETLLHLPPAEIVRFGLIDNRGMVVVAGLFGLLYEAGFMAAWIDTIEERFAPVQMDALIARGLLLQAVLALGSLIAALIVVRLFSVALALVTLYDFKLTQIATDFRVRYGLLTRVSLTLRLARIQAVHQTETVLHRLFGRVCLRVDLAGGGGTAEQGGESDGQRTRWLAPLVRLEQSVDLTARALPDTDVRTHPQWQPLAEGARRRIFAKSVAWWLIGSGILALVFRAYSPLLILLVGAPLSIWYASMYVRYTRWALQPDALIFRSGWLTRKSVIVPRNRVQAALVEESPFDRRHRMACVAVDTAGAGSRSDTIRIPYLDRDIAVALSRSLYLSSSKAPIEGISDTAEFEAV